MKAVITQLETGIITGEGVNVNALSSTLTSAGALNTKYEWDFGDPGSQYNDLTGWNAGHVYDKPGVYTITLKLTDPSGVTSTATSLVTVASDNRPIVYVDSVNGSDSNDGSSPGLAVRSAARAFQLVATDTKVEFHRGESFAVNQTLMINGHDIYVGAYGSGANPTLVRGVGDGAVTLFVTNTSSNITIQGLTFDSIWPAVNGIADEINADGVWAEGTNLVVRDNTFLNIQDDINGSMRPNGVIVLNNSSPLLTGLRGYFCWVDGTNWSILGNAVANSTRQHDIRGNSTAIVGVLITGNNLTNLVRPEDPGETPKTTINFRAGNYVYVSGNTLNDGTMSFAPAGAAMATATNNWVVVEDNFFHDMQLQLWANPQHVMVRDNFFDASGFAQIDLIATDSMYPALQLGDVTITGNTGVNNGVAGQFLYMAGNYAPGSITLTHNLYAAPNLQNGVNAGAAVYVETGTIAAFASITGNIWPSASGALYTNPGAVNYVGGSNLPTGYLTADQWNAQSVVGSDVFQDVTLPAKTYVVTVNGVTAGAAGFAIAA
jgi:hypothetical protein